MNKRVFHRVNEAKKWKAYKIEKDKAEVQARREARIRQKGGHA